MVSTPPVPPITRESINGNVQVKQCSKQAGLAVRLDFRLEMAQKARRSHARRRTRHDQQDGNQDGEIMKESPPKRANSLWAGVELNYRPHAYQPYRIVRTCGSMSDFSGQISRSAVKRPSLFGTTPEDVDTDLDTHAQTAVPLLHGRCGISRAAVRRRGAARSLESERHAVNRPIGEAKVEHSTRTCPRFLRLPDIVIVLRFGIVGQPAAAGRERCHRGAAGIASA